MVDPIFKERFSKSRISLLSYYPFWGKISMYLTLIENSNMPYRTTAVDIKGNFYYDPEWVKKLSETDLTAEIAHEIGHLVTKTMQRRPKGANPGVWNKASDIVIDIMLMDSGLTPSWVMKEVTDESCQEKYKGMSTQQVYKDLMQNPPPNIKAMLASGDGSSGDIRQCCSAGNMGKISKAEEAKLMAQWKKNIISAAHSSKSRGKLTGTLADWLHELIEPKIKWTDYLRVTAQKHLKTTWSWRRAGRRGEALNIRLPGKNPDTPTAVMAFDTSGSMSNEQINEGVSEGSEILYLCGGEVRALFFDCEVYEDIEVKDFRKDLVKIKRGGTDFGVVFDKLKEDPPELLVIFTDLYAPYPREDPGYPVVWCVTREHNDEPIPFGEMVVMES